ncbi:protein kinase [Sorangium cellulosum]|uniref:Protein kinase n=1 Tax=Sorangium cellulosum TaxID=56 RepID=A0A2L0FC05_SORCE|nr:bifunctional serine/threonine-protein kinase/formylglycine-generating enzyme family protein [Sorangium cellulosum]AUX49136.1 protein kinase [Sorangium cellulosum]
MSDPAAILRRLASELCLSPEVCADIERVLAEHAAHASSSGVLPTLVRATQPPGAAAESSPAPGAAAEVCAPAAASPWERYEDLGPIGRGGMGEVRRVRDRVMGRVLAMKLLRLECHDNDEARWRFLAEARLTASLQHPGIVPVHDCGMLPTGQLWFTMKEVRGRTFSALLRAIHAGADAGPSPEALRRGLDVFLRVCEAVAYAHGRGVLHRDLKPENVMIGEFGEVLVMDWGVARSTARGACSAALEESGHSTHAGLILGTPVYMPPEQARGDLDRLGPPSDVYALGAILYELLSGTPPYRGTALAVVAQVVQRAPEPLASRCRGPIPRDLAAICERAMARSPSDRFATVEALAEEIRGFLDGARRRERARALVEEARALAPRIAGLRACARDLRGEAKALLARLEPFAPAAEKAQGWALEDEARALDRAAALDEATWHQKLRAALNEAPDCDDAHAALADAYLADLRAAEAARDAEAAARAEAFLRSHARERHVALLRGAGALSLRTEPEGAEVWLLRYVEQERRLRVEPQGLLGHTPLREVPLAQGSYLLLIRAPGYRDVRYPVRIGRGEHWDGVRPGGAAPHGVPLLRAEALGDDGIYVPAGWFAAGGDAQAGDSLPACRVWVDGFVVRQHPVTQAEYLVFLNDLLAQGREPEAVAACPRASRGIAGNVDVPLFARDVDGRFVLGPQREAQARHPVASIDWHAASAYTSWLAARTGVPWRLPGEIEREKAARGVDGRFFPWGDEPEPTWACMAGSRPGPATPVPVDDYPTDESPYAVRGLSGNVRDWCIELWRHDGPAVVDGVARIVPAGSADPGLRALRGGSWVSAPAAVCRAAGRFAARPDERFSAVGFRLARPIAGGDV